MKTAPAQKHSVSKLTSPLDRPAATARHAVRTLGVTIVYEDALTRQWALAAYERIAKMTGTEGVRATWWKIGDLSQPGVLAGAVSTALRADMIVVAIRAAEGLPLPFYVWVEQWLPHRLVPAGALAALLPASSAANSRPGRVADYLRAAARQGRLDFLIKEHKVPTRSLRSRTNSLRRGWSEQVLSFAR